MNNSNKEHGKSLQNSNASLTKPTPTEVARKYRVDDLTSSLIPGGGLRKILEHLELGIPISYIAQNYLRSKGFLALLRYAKKEIAFGEFLKAAGSEQADRCLTAEAKTLKEQAEQKLQEEALRARQKLAQERWAAEKRALDYDPRRIAKARQSALRQQYGIFNFIDEDDFPRLMDILRRVDNGVRLSKDEIFWLSPQGEGYEYYTTELREGFYKNEAEFHAGEFKKNKDPWSAVNASSDYRKCNRAKTAESMLGAIDISKLKNPKLKSALCTTHGGVKRDLKKWEEALGFGEQAHHLTPEDYRPCTLLGAVNFEIHRYDLSHSWYAKAVERGYSEKAVDNELRSIFMRAEKTEQKAMRDDLLKRDSNRYSWVKKP